VPYINLILVMAIAWQWAEAWNSFLVGTVEVSAPAPEAQQ